MQNIVNSILSNVRNRRGLFILLIILTAFVAILAIISAINLNGSLLPLDLSNIAFIKFLRGEASFVFLITGTILNLLIYYALIVLFCSNKFLFPLAILFYLYFVYTQIIIFVSILLIYGLLNALLLLMFLLIYYLAVFAILLLLILDLSNICGCCYFQNCFNIHNCNLLILSAALLLISIIFCIILTILKNFVILLVF